MASNSNPQYRTSPYCSTATSPSPLNSQILQDGVRLLRERAATPQPATGSLEQRTLLPRHLCVEPADLEKYLNDDPLFGTRGAAILLGISMDLIKKWRQRGHGPAYYQFGEGGPILYSLSALNDYKAAHLVIPHQKGRKL